MKVGIKDKSTIKALDDISSKYPFAAALLAYAIVERVLKEYIIKNRKNRSLVDYCYKKRVHKEDTSWTTYRESERIGQIFMLPIIDTMLLSILSS
jgi:hypothetical protein